MRTGLDKTIDTLIRQGATTGEVVDFLSNNLTTKELTEELAKSLQENQILKSKTTLVRISKSDFDRHFRIIGMKSDGTPENRGSNRWKK